MTRNSSEWNTRHEKAFHQLQKTLIDQTKLVNRNCDQCYCVYTDATDLFSAGVVTQCRSNEFQKPALDQTHHPLAFRTGECIGAETG